MPFEHKVSIYVDYTSFHRLKRKMQAYNIVVKFNLVFIIFFKIEFLTKGSSPFSYRIMVFILEIKLRILIKIYVLKLPMKTITKITLNLEILYPRVSLSQMRIYISFVLELSKLQNRCQ